ncbi:MAG: chorismate-binding protein, partial [Sandaracinaceae bacterium]|nr:chorismate-binding protein [Sandaracinaceae bacterium]
MQPLSVIPASSPALEAHATTHYITGGGVHVERHTLPLTLTEARAALSSMARALDTQPGVLLGSSFEFPGRYSRYDIGLVNPPLRITCSSERVELAALNMRGAALLRMLLPVVSETSALMDVQIADDVIRARVRPAVAPESEEERSRSASVFDLLRALVAHLGHAGDGLLGLYGAFGYGLGFRFEPVRSQLPLPLGARDLVLYLPDELVFVDSQEGRAERVTYELATGTATTRGLARPVAGAADDLPRGGHLGPVESDHTEAEFEAGVRSALDAFARGDLFEVVLSQTFRATTDVRPSDLYASLRTLNPAPYG